MFMRFLAYRHMDSWVDEQTGFLLQTEFKQWFESVVVKALNTMVPIKPNLYELKIPDPADNTETSYKKTKWFIVPKPKKNNPDGTIWRLAFHEQERELIHNKGILKPVCRLLKVSITLYYIVLKEGSIPYYWDSRYNLLEGLETDNKINIMCRLAKIIADIRKKSLTEPYIMAKYLVPKDEYEIVKKKFEIPALDLTPAKPVLVKKDSKVSSSIQIPVANKQVEASSSDCAALTGAVSQEKTCTNCTVKIELMMEVLQKLLVKVNGLEKSLQVLQTQNENLKDQFLVKVNGLEKIMEAVQNENENLKDRICLINAQNENILNLH
ncbi:hypothetical protein C0J52_16470 [Blattella germanica]|nr:hypothetical protein C0J52_16470 [Blattella germanica]